MGIIGRIQLFRRSESQQEPIGVQVTNEHPAFWDEPEPELTTLDRMKKKNPKLNDLIAALDLKE